MKQFTFAMLFIVFFYAAPLYAEQYQVVFETTGCDGSSGFSTIAVEEIYKIQDGDCSDPKNPEQRLQQLLVHNGSGSYTVYTVRQTDAREIMNEVKSYMKARRTVLERANTVIVTE